MILGKAETRPATSDRATTKGNASIKPSKNKTRGNRNAAGRLNPNKVDADSLWRIAHQMTGADPASDPSTNTGVVPAGYTYFGQLLAHDITHAVRGHKEIIRSDFLDLESIYGDDAEKLKYTKQGRFITSILDGLQEYDLPRKKRCKWKRAANIADFRNDMHLIIAQMTLAMMMFHNWVFNRISNRADNTAGRLIYTQEFMRHHFQWLVVNDYLPRICDPEVLKKIWPNRTKTTWSNHPLLQNNLIKLRPDSRSGHTVFHASDGFRFAAGRFGHTQARSRYILNTAESSELPLFSEAIPPTRNSITGQRSLVPFWSLQWNLFFDSGGSKLQLSRGFDKKLAGSLDQLPDGFNGTSGFHEISKPVSAVMKRRLRNLAFRTLYKGALKGLPSGQDAARNLGLEAAEIIDPSDQDPLWYYVVKEAEVQSNGERLGLLGSWIVAGTIANLLKKQAEIRGAESIAHKSNEWWEPASEVGGTKFRVVDIPRFAGLPVTRADWDKYIYSGPLDVDPIGRPRIV